MNMFQVILFYLTSLITCDIQFRNLVEILIFLFGISIIARQVHLSVSIVIVTDVYICKVSWTKSVWKEQSKLFIYYNTEYEKSEIMHFISDTSLNYNTFN